MRKFILCSVFCILFSSYASASQYQSCHAVRVANNIAENGMKHLMNNYPGTLAFYGISAIMLKESNPQQLEDYAAGLVTAFVACSIMIDYKSCDFVAGRLATLFSSRAAICIADKNLSCGVCN